MQNEETQTVDPAENIWIAVGDIHGNTSRFLEIPELAQAKGIIITGDITENGGAAEAQTVLDFIDQLNLPVLAQIGNMDKPEIDSLLSSNGINLHTRLYELMPSIVIFGIGGSIPTPEKTPSEFSEISYTSWLDEMWKGARDYRRRILISHNPPKDTDCDFASGGAGHAGSAAVRKFIAWAQPDLCICGHIHESKSTTRVGGTLVINPGRLSEGGYVVIREKNGFLSARLKTLPKPKKSKDGEEQPETPVIPFPIREEKAPAWKEVKILTYKDAVRESAAKGAKVAAEIMETQKDTEEVKPTEVKPKAPPTKEELEAEAMKKKAAEILYNIGRKTKSAPPETAGAKEVKIAPESVEKQTKGTEVKPQGSAPSAKEGQDAEALKKKAEEILRNMSRKTQSAPVETAAAKEAKKAPENVEKQSKPVEVKPQEKATPTKAEPDAEELKRKAEEILRNMSRKPKGAPAETATEAKSAPETAEKPAKSAEVKPQEKTTPIKEEQDAEALKKKAEEILRNMTRKRK